MLLFNINKVFLLMLAIIFLSVSLPSSAYSRGFRLTTRGLKVAPEGVPQVVTSKHIDNLLKSSSVPDSARFRVLTISDGNSTKSRWGLPYIYVRPLGPSFSTRRGVREVIQTDFATAAEPGYRGTQKLRYQQLDNHALSRGEIPEGLITEEKFDRVFGRKMLCDCLHRGTTCGGIPVMDDQLLTYLRSVSGLLTDNGEAILTGTTPALANIRRTFTRDRTPIASERLPVVVAAFNQLPNNHFHATFFPSRRGGDMTVHIGPSERFQ